MSDWRINVLNKTKNFIVLRRNYPGPIPGRRGVGGLKTPLHTLEIQSFIVYIYILKPAGVVMHITNYIENNYLLSLVKSFSYDAIPMKKNYYDLIQPVSVEFEACGIYGGAIYWLSE